MPARVTPPQAPGTGSSPPDDGRPATLRVILTGVAVEALLLVVAAGAVVVELISGGSGSVGVSIFLVLFFLGVAAALVAAGRALWAGRRGGRAPIGTWQVLQAVVGVSLLTADVPWAVVAGVLLAGVAVVVFILLMTRRVVAATSR